MVQSTKLEMEGETVEYMLPKCQLKDCQIYAVTKIGPMLNS